MKTKILKGVLFISLATLLMSFAWPTGWLRSGDTPKSYEMGIDKGAGQDGKNAATIKSIDEKIDGFGTLMQYFKAEKYLGKRVRMTGMLKTKNVSNWAGFWLRVDTKTPVKAVVFDNMHDGEKDRSVKGTTDWKKYEIILDVPANALTMSFGAWLNGTGQIWFNNIDFEIVSPSTPTTGIEMESLASTYSSQNLVPINLDFKK